jgi:hypothetical protein
MGEKDASVLVYVVYELLLLPSGVSWDWVCGHSHDDRLGCYPREAYQIPRGREGTGTIAGAMSVFVSRVICVASQLPAGWCQW